MNKKKIENLETNHFKQKTRIIEEIMTDLIDYLKSCKYSENGLQDSKLTDGRVKSSVLEKTLVMPLIKEWMKSSSIIKKYDLYEIIPKDRALYDVMFKSNSDESIIIPCNIKVSTYKQADNLNSINAMDLITAGYLSNSISYRKDSELKCAKEIKKTKKFSEPIDFYFICVKKNDMSQTFFTSMLTIKEFNVNAMNLLQCNWETNKKIGRTSLYELTEEDVQNDLEHGVTPRVYRSYQKSIDYVIDSFIECYVLRNIHTLKSIKLLKLQRNNSKNVFKELRKQEGKSK